MCLALLTEEEQCLNFKGSIFLKRGSCKKNRRHTLMYFFGFRGNNSDTENMIGKVPNYEPLTTIRVKASLKIGNAN